MIVLIWNSFFFLLGLGLLVTVHEYGHFWVARRCGIKVLRFSIGFGKVLWRKVDRHGTEFVISLLPLGGYVKMLDARSEEVPAELRDQEYNAKPVWQRILVVSAGPVINIIFAVLLYWLVFLIGIPSIKPVVGEVKPNSIVAQAQMPTDWQIYKIGDELAPDWESINMLLVTNLGAKYIDIGIHPVGQPQLNRTVRLDTQTWDFKPDQEAAFTTLGIEPKRLAADLYIASIENDSAASKAGLKDGDKIVQVGAITDDWQQMLAIIKANPNQEIFIAVERNNQLLDIFITPDIKYHNNEAYGALGIGIQQKAKPGQEELLTELKYGLFGSLEKSIVKVKQIFFIVWNILGKLLTGNLGLESLSGPISIAKGAGISAEIGIVYYLSFLALISVNLGIMNILPLPVLDGGHLLFLAIEAIMRKPVPLKIQEFAYRIGFMVLMALFAIALFYDFLRL